MTKYEVSQLSPQDIEGDLEVLVFLAQAAEDVAKLYGNKFSWQYFKILDYAHNHRITLCRRNGVPVGTMLTRLYPSIFDDGVTIAYQDLLYAKPRTRAARLLLKDFIDFSRVNANHCITCIGEKTNIKRRSLERLGFKKLEELYRMEI